MNLIGFLTFIRRELDRSARTAIQSLVSPWLSALLFITVFGAFVGSRVGMIEGIPYVRFVLPGIISMNVMMASFMASSFSLIFQRFLRHIEEVLVAPLSYAEIAAGFAVVGVLRGVVVGCGIYLIGLLFGAAGIAHPLWFLFYVFFVSLVFSLLGMLVGLWAKTFEGAAVVPTFVITPLSFLGGMFTSVSMIPERLRPLVALNPVFYLVDGVRYAMTGVAESDRGVGILIILALFLCLAALVWRLFSIGWRIRT